MRVKTNERFIAQKARLGKYSSIAGLAILTGGMVINFAKPELFDSRYFALVAGFGVASIGAYKRQPAGQTTARG